MSLCRCRPWPCWPARHRSSARTRIAQHSSTRALIPPHPLQEEVRDLLVGDSRAPRPVVTIRELPTGVSLAGKEQRALGWGGGCAEAV